MILFRNVRLSETERVWDDRSSQLADIFVHHRPTKRQLTFVFYDDSQLYHSQTGDRKTVDGSRYTYYRFFDRYPKFDFPSLSQIASSHGEPSVSKPSDKKNGAKQVIFCLEKMPT